MKSYRSDWILVIFLMLWLPIQSVGAAALSVCIQEESGNHSTAEATGENHSHESCHASDDVEAVDSLLSSLPCDDTSCYAGSGLILLNYAAEQHPGNTSVIAALYSSFASFIPDQPQRPPLTI